mmetsp:Transcript_27010/g.79810  ORF Transcript_27010/g.79810 Transcript_27010/m.79810 type:complete len:137 (+) Transcript_27010:838-1248(+)
MNSPVREMLLKAQTRSETDRGLASSIFCYARPKLLALVPVHLCEALAILAAGTSRINWTHLSCSNTRTKGESESRASASRYTEKNVLESFSKTVEHRDSCAIFTFGRVFPTGGHTEWQKGAVEYDVKIMSLMVRKL